MLGRKTGGRQAGTPNKRSKCVEERLASLGCDPIEGMAKIAMDPATPLAIRASMFRELAQYIAPKRKALEFEEPVQVESVSFPELSEDEYRQLVREALEKI